MLSDSRCFLALALRKAVLAPEKERYASDAVFPRNFLFYFYPKTEVPCQTSRAPKTFRKGGCDAEYSNA